jgi:hypothetical protein
MKPSLWSLIAILVATLVPSSPARGSLVVALDLPGMVQRADHIAVTEVVSVRADWDAAHERIVSTVELRVVESWKGASTESRFTVVQPGGTVDGISMVVFGMPNFKAGERTLVFLRGSTRSAQVVGLAQGKRAIRPDAATGRWLVDAPDLAGALQMKGRSPQVTATPGASTPRLHTPTATPAPLTTPATPRAKGGAAAIERRTQTLDEVRGQVRDLVKAGR